MTPAVVRPVEDRGHLGWSILLKLSPNDVQKNTAQTTCTIRRRFETENSMVVVDGSTDREQSRYSTRKRIVTTADSQALSRVPDRNELSQSIGLRVYCTTQDINHTILSLQVARRGCNEKGRKPHLFQFFLLLADQVIPSGQNAVSIVSLELSIELHPQPL